MTLAPEMMTAEITTRCTCIYCPECMTGQYGTPGDRCDNCDEITIDRAYCDADCWGMMREDFAYVVGQWMEDCDVENFYIAGHNMGWQRRASHTGKLSDAMAALALLAGDFDCSLDVTYDQTAGTLEVTRRSHDEMGAAFTFTPCEVCAHCDEGITYNEDERAYVDLGGFTYCTYAQDERHAEHL